MVSLIRFLVLRSMPPSAPRFNTAAERGCRASADSLLRSKMMADVALERVRHQPSEIPAADMDHRQVIARLEVDVRSVREVTVDYRVNSVHSSQWRNRSRLAVFEQTR